MTPAADLLAEARGPLPAAEARQLMCHVLGWSRARLGARPEQALTDEQAARFRELVDARAAGEPLAYLTGEREFYGRRFAVGPAVLIPRPETEVLVDAALELLRRVRAPRILDLGTGSGVLAVTLALERPGGFVAAVDRSPAALELARRNAAALGAEVSFLAGDWLQAIGARFDLIVANPPYVAAGDAHLAAGDLRREPRHALTDGSADGLASLRTIIAQAPGRLAAGGALAVEHGYEQAAAVRDLFRTAGFGALDSMADLAGIARVAVGTGLRPVPGQAGHVAAAAIATP